MFLAIKLSILSMVCEPYDPCDDLDNDDTDLSDYDAGVDESPDVNDDGEIVSSSSKGKVRDFAMQDNHDVSTDDGGKTETRETTLDQEGLDGENIFAGGGEDTDDDRPYDPTEEFDPDPEYREGGVGGGRRATLEAIDRRDKLDEVSEDDINELKDLLDAVREIHLDGFMSPPEEVAETIENVYNGLRDDAKPHYLTDETLLKRINSARRYFDETVLPRLKREKEMPSPVEAGRANYPADKARRRSKKSREAREELKETLGTATGTSGGVMSAARGARQRALNAIGSSVAEENERAREETREEMKDRIETGDLMVYGMPTPSVGEVVRVNKKSVTARRPNPRYGNKDPLTGETIDEEWSEGRAKYTESTLSLIEEEDLGTLGVDTRAGNISQDSFDSFDELRKEVGLPIERESRYVDNKDRECAQRLADKAHISEDRAATIVDYFGDFETVRRDASVNLLTELDGIGEKTAEKVVEISDNNTNMTRSSNDEEDVDELAHDTPPTWGVDEKPEDDETGWSYWWECDTGDRIHASKEHRKQSYHVEFHGEYDPDEGDGEYQKLAEGLPTKRDAVEVAIGSMGANKCVPPEDRRARAREYGEGFNEMQAQARADRRAELNSRKVEDNDVFEERNRLPATYDPVEDIRSNQGSSYDPSVDLDEVFNETPGEETQKEVLAEEESDQRDKDDVSEPIEVDFGAKDVADSYRDEHEEHLSDEDDRRRNTVMFAPQRPRRAPTRQKTRTDRRG